MSTTPSKKNDKDNNKNRKPTAAVKKKASQKNTNRAQKILKKATQKAFVLQPDQATPDPLLLKTVCFKCT